MSCIRFNTEAQRKQLKYAVSVDEPIASWLSPDVTDSKTKRIHMMAQDRNPKIRESAALSINLPIATAWLLAQDKSDNVRSCLARNENVPEGVLRLLAVDKSATVRQWIAVNYCTPYDTIDMLATDSDKQVRQLIEWRKSIQ